MRVLAIDPGYDRAGAAILEYQNGVETVCFSTCIETTRTDPLPTRLRTLGDAFLGLLNDHTPTAIAIETLFFNKNVKTAFGVAQARGVLLYLAEQAEFPIYEFGPQEIKVAVTGYGNSDKAAVTSMVRQTVRGVPSTALDDEYDAIAIGVTCLAHYGRGR